MSYAVITTKVEPEVKRKAAQISKELGVPLSVAIKMFLRQLIRTRSLSVSADETPNAYLRERIRQAKENYKKGDVSPKLHGAEEAIAYLEKQGI
jgi:addiction module RelB/DinJ family antitoxin